MIPQIEPDLTEAEAQAAYDVVLSGWVNEGKLSAEFGTRFAEAVGSKYAVPTTSCTAAMALSLMALEIKDREVIVPDITMIGTPMAVIQSGNTPVVVDVRPRDGCMDPKAVRSAITPKTAAIIPVHVNGRNALPKELLAVAQDHELAIVEDAACCLGSQILDGEPVQLGTLGATGCFSLAATKIAVSGQGGAVVTNDADLYERITRLKDWGRFGEKGNDHPDVGFNFKFTDIQAAIALVQLKRLPKLVARKREIYGRYRARLGELMFSSEDPPAFCPWYVDIRGQHLAAPLREQGIGSQPIWPALHQQGAMGMAHLERAYPVATAMARDVLWLPSSTKLTDEHVDHVCGAVLAAS